MRASQFEQNADDWKSRLHKQSLPAQASIKSTCADLLRKSAQIPTDTKLYDCDWALLALEV
ncbi:MULTISPECIES: hypothetical protein [Nostocales]|uniref:Uncharacterized protein n=3 Tax=Nostocales TaxID=1161 RepID=A0A0C1QT14_9CYAN|nr:hypothetical protein [Tolypothrix bouteillei]KAF3889599.1 hypothetical protein DA73_0400032105 [Tolypothrix bouteillei VB521301]